MVITLIVANVTVENYETALTYEVAALSTHTLGMFVRPDGTVPTATTDEIGGMIVRVGDTGSGALAGTGAQSLVLKNGIVRDSTATSMGIAANVPVYSNGDGTAVDTKPGADGAVIVDVGQVISTTRFYVNPVRYERGA